MTKGEVEKRRCSKAERKELQSLRQFQQQLTQCSQSQRLLLQFLPLYFLSLPRFLQSLPLFLQFLPLLLLAPRKCLIVQGHVVPLHVPVMHGVPTVQQGWPL